jgi:hypothetical protein
MKLFINNFSAENMIKATMSGLPDGFVADTTNTRASVADTHAPLESVIPNQEAKTAVLTIDASQVRKSGKVKVVIDTRDGSESEYGQLEYVYDPGHDEHPDAHVCVTSVSPLINVKPGDQVTLYGSNLSSKWLTRVDLNGRPPCQCAIVSQSDTRAAIRVPATCTLPDGYYNLVVSGANDHRQVLRRQIAIKHAQ